MVKKGTIWADLEPFINSREFLHLADLSRKLKKPHPTLRKHLLFFEKQGILTKEIKGRLTLYKLNFSNPLIIDYISLAEKEKLLEKCKNNLVLKELVDFLHKTLDEENKALIFGSSTENIKNANDIDLIITGKIKFKEKIKDFEKKFGLEIHLINVENLKGINEALKKEIIKKHLIVQGSEEIIKWLI